MACYVVWFHPVQHSLTESVYSLLLLTHLFQPNLRSGPGKVNWGGSETTPTVYIFTNNLMLNVLENKTQKGWLYSSPFIRCFDRIISANNRIVLSMCHFSRKDFIDNNSFNHYNPKWPYFHHPRLTERGQGGKEILQLLNKRARFWPKQCPQVDTPAWQHLPGLQGG